MKLEDGEWIEIRTIDDVKSKDKAISILIKANCVVLGSSSSKERIFHIDDLVTSLDSNLGWEFELNNLGGFDVNIRLDSIEIVDIEKAINKLQCLLDCLAISQHVGFFIQHYSASPIQKSGISCSVGGVESLLDRVNLDEITTLNAVISSSNKSMIAARGLNQSYIENCLPSRLSMLWSAVEEVFKIESERLLTDDEIKNIIEAAEGIESLKEDKTRLELFKGAIKDPNRLPLMSRNEGIAKNISCVMDISEDDIYSKIRKTTSLRGKHVHTLSLRSWNEIEESEKFLQTALLYYLSDQKEKFEKTDTKRAIEKPKIS